MMATVPPAQPANDGLLSLLSLSMAAASVVPIPVSDSATSKDESAAGPTLNGASSLDALTASVGAPHIASSIGSSVKHHRRLASTGKARRRLSDARDAASRPTISSLQPGPASLPLAGLTLSSVSPPGPHFPHTSTSVPVTNPIAIPIQSNGTAVYVPVSSEPDVTGTSHGSVKSMPVEVDATPVFIPKNGKKRGMEHKCETCSKVYRHPSCLIKHRWEHTPHWRESSKYVLSKHQQVQLLEAAAILSHLSPSAHSLPEDRSLWPSFLSKDAARAALNASSVSPPTHFMPSSVPAQSTTTSANTRATSAGPRMYDYALPSQTNGGGSVTQVRPGLVIATASATTQRDGEDMEDESDSSDAEDVEMSSTTGAGVVVNNTSATNAIPVPGFQAGMGLGLGNGTNFTSYRNGPGGDAGLGSWASSTSVTGGWSLPSSELRSSSKSTWSGSGSERGAEDIDVDVNVDGEREDHGMGFRVERGLGKGDEEDGDEEYKYGYRHRRAYDHDAGEVPTARPRGREGAQEDDGYEYMYVKRHEKFEEEEWDGMEMEMDME